MPNILIVSKYYYPFSGGIEENVKYVAEHAARYHDVTVLACNHEDGDRDDYINGVKVIRKNVHFVMKSQPVSLGLFMGVDLSSFDLVHFHSPNPFATFYFILVRLFSRSAPVIVTHHMDIFGRRFLRMLTLPLIRYLIRGSNATIVTSAKNVAISRDLPKGLNYEVVPLALQPAEFSISDQIRGEALKWRAAVAGDAPLVGFVGRHARYKGLDVLMNALVQLPAVHAFIGGDGPYRNATEEQAKRLGIEGRVHFLGRMTHREKLKLLAAIDVFAFPSTEITEAFGISQMEAMLCAKPVVASNLPTGVTDVAIDNQTALLFEPGDATQLASKISMLISDNALASRIGSAAQKHILANMTYDKVADRTLSIFERALKVQSTTHHSDAA